MKNGLNFNLIQAAVSGDKVAIEKIVSIYEPYINKLASKKLFDEEGNEYIGIDIDLKEHLKTKLIEVIFKYRALA